MGDIPVATITGAQAVLEGAAVKAFKASLRGELLCPDDHDYDRARKIWNGMVDRRPAMIVQCAGVADVINAVNFVRRKNLLVTVRSGGHNVAGTAVCDGGIMIDLSRMKSVRVDPMNRTARADPGLTWGEFDRETQAFGLATTGGICSETGITGVTLGGGFGWLMRKHGLSCDNLVSVDVIIADGGFLTASAIENADLFWGVRGGSGNYGVVTSLEYRLHPVGAVLAGMVLHPLQKAKEVFKFYREYTGTAPDELSAWACLLTSPDGVPMIAILACYIGPIEAGEQAVRPLREFGPPIADYLRVMPYVASQSLIDASFPPGRQNYWKSNLLRELSDDAVDVLVSRFAVAPSPLSSVLIEHLGGAVSRVGKDETAFNHRDAPYDFVILSMWSDPAESGKQIRWTDEFWRAMQPFSSGGVYVNYLGQEGEDRVKAAYGTNCERLVTLKNKYDPKNLFRLNQNIKPATAAS